MYVTEEELKDFIHLMIEEKIGALVIMRGLLRLGVHPNVAKDLVSEALDDSIKNF